MRCVLTTEIPVNRVAVFAEMAWMERRPELGLLCRSAQNQGNRITVAVVQSALPGLPDAGANNVITWCERLGLCDERGGLTALGENVADADEAPVPEQGVYGLWLAQHPVLGRRVLAVERLASNRDQRFESIEPRAVELDRGKVFRSVRDEKERFMVRDLPTNHGHPGLFTGGTRATCRLRWTLDFNANRDQWQLDGTIEMPLGNGKYTMGPIKHESESDGLDLWRTIEFIATDLRQFGEWDRKKHLLAVPASSLKEDEARTFRRSFTVPRIELPNKGTYENTTFEDVPIGPRAAADAQQWAMVLFERDLKESSAYRSRTEARARFADLTEDTPLEAFAPTLPSHSDLLMQFSKDPERFWSLATPVDLSPVQPGLDELGALRIGAPAQTAAVEPPDVIRIPYRGGWSMRKLVERLLSGVIPRRVLLCDRYVRGDGNLNALKLFFAALRAVAPNVAVDIWTGDEEDADFKKIQAITSGAPRSYRDVFGRSPPHDRYVLLMPTHGQGFGWHMSNSLLHARADASGAAAESPLRWKDLAATRVTADELEPPLRQWFAGGLR